MDELITKLEEIDFTKIDIDELLENRDSESFDCEWIRVYKEIELLKKKAYSDSNKKYSLSVRENVFKRIFELSGDGDLAGYVSDDFGLIIDSRILSYSDIWLNRLIDCYENVKIPCGSL